MLKDRGESTEVMKAAVNSACLEAKIKYRSNARKKTQATMIFLSVTVKSTERGVCVCLINLKNGND